jgi:hypothetical protein
LKEIEMGRQEYQKASGWQQGKTGILEQEGKVKGSTILTDTRAKTAVRFGHGVSTSSSILAGERCQCWFK